MFSNWRKGKDGLNVWCKICASEYNKFYRKKNREKIRVKKKEYERKHPINRIRLRESDRKNLSITMFLSVELYEAAKSEKQKKQQSEYREKNKEKRREYTAKWRKENKHILREYKQNRRARKKANGGKLSSGLIGKLFKLQKGKCACCGNPLGNNFHVDHIMPLFLGGKNEDNNIQLLTPRCNSVKRAKHPIDFMRSKGFLL